MRNEITKSVSRRTIATTAMATLIAIAATASASPGPADDRLLQASTSWATRTSVSAADLQSVVDAGAFRITDLRVEDASPLTVSAVLVHNTGPYAVSGEFFYHGVDVSTSEATFRGNGKRPIVMQPYIVNGEIKIAGATVPNTGANDRNWHIIWGTFSYVTSHIPTGWRPMTIGTYVDPNAGDRRYALIVVENTEHYGWWWYFGADALHLPEPGSCASLIDASADDNNAMNVNLIYYATLPTPHGVCEGVPEFDTSFSDLVNEAKNIGDRLLFLTHFTLHGSGTADGDTEWFTSSVD